MTRALMVACLLVWAVMASPATADATPAARYGAFIEAMGAVERAPPAYAVENGHGRAVVQPTRPWAFASMTGTLDRPMPLVLDRAARTGAVTGRSGGAERFERVP